jgi:hypothetical protein
MAVRVRPWTGLSLRATPALKAPRTDSLAKQGGAVVAAEAGAVAVARPRNKAADHLLSSSGRTDNPFTPRGATARPLRPQHPSLRDNLRVSLR